jgi:hypothetical protein
LGIGPGAADLSRGEIEDSDPAGVQGERSVQKLS